MKVKVLYFAGLREAVGAASETVEVDAEKATVAGLRETLMARGEPYAGALSNARRLRAAVNQELSAPEDPVREGDEVAFFPPVTGG